MYSIVLGRVSILFGDSFFFLLGGIHYFFGGGGGVVEMGSFISVHFIWGVPCFWEGYIHFIWGYSLIIGGVGHFLGGSFFIGTGPHTENKGHMISCFHITVKGQ